METTCNVGGLLMLNGRTILITSGGTLEKWDEVRGHTNLATGTIGTYLAEQALAQGARVLYLHGYFAKVPAARDGLVTVRFEGIEDLGEKLQAWVAEADAAIMAAAVSDWVVDKITDADGREIGGGKMPSDVPPIIHFKKAPKLITEIKSWNPNLLLAGFKLEHSTDRAYLVERALLRMQTWRSDLVVANSSASLHGTEALHLLVEPDGTTREFADKFSTADALLATIAAKLERR